MDRWRRGVSLPVMRGDVMLEIQLAGSMSYALDALPAGKAERLAS